MAKIYTSKEVKRRRVNFQIFAGIVVIIACAVLLAALISWIIRDSRDSFASLWKIFQDALIIPE